MGLAGGVQGTLGVWRGALPPLWRLAALLLLLGVWEVKTQAEEDTKPVYVWQTGRVPPAYPPSLSLGLHARLDLAGGAGKDQLLEVKCPPSI